MLRKINISELIQSGVINDFEGAKIEHINNSLELDNKALLEDYNRDELGYIELKLFKK